MKDAHTALSGKLASDEELLQTLLTGLSSSNAKTKGGGYMGQLAEAKAKIAQGAAEEEQAKVKVTMQQKELSALEARLKDHSKEAKDNTKRVENLIKGLEELEKNVERCGWNAENEKELESALREGRDTVKLLTEVGSRTLTTSCSYSLVTLRNGKGSRLVLVGSTLTMTIRAQISIEGK